MVIGLGSVDPHEVGAVRDALRRMGLLNVPIQEVLVNIESNAQLTNFEEMFTVALRRALNIVYSTDPAIGIADGIIRGSQVTMGISVVVLVNQRRDVITMTTEGMRFPQEDVAEAARLGFEKTTVAEVMAARLGGDKSDPYAIISNGRFNRRDILSSTIEKLLVEL